MKCNRPEERGDQRRPLCRTCWRPLGCKSHAFQISRDADLRSYRKAIAQIACKALRAEIAKGGGNLCSNTKTHRGCSASTPGQTRGKTKYRRDYLRDEIQDEMATEQRSLSAFPRLNNPPTLTQPPRPAILLLVSLYPMHLPRMSDNRNTLCSSKVRAIRSTPSSAEKTANVKMVKKPPLLSTYHLSDYQGRPAADKVLTGPVVSGAPEWD